MRTMTAISERIRTSLARARVRQDIGDLMLALLTLLILASQVRAASLSGDFNGDWKVDAADFVAARASAGNLAAWRLNYGKTVADYPGVVTIKSTDDIQTAINA